MTDPFDGRRYLEYLRMRWRLSTVVLATALATALGISVLLPTKYTATVKLVIEPPAGGDPRAATVLSPIYLESLRSYEYFASSDQLFARAAAKFNLRADAGSQPIEAVKREVLRVSIPRNTKVMEIAATFSNPTKAHDLALYIAEETVDLNRSTDRAREDELTAAAKSEVASLARRLKAAELANQVERIRTPTPDSLQAELTRIRQMQTDLSRTALSVEVWDRDEDRARAQTLQQRGAELERRATRLETTLASRTAAIETADAELKSARTAYEQLAKQVREMAGMSGFRGERMSIIDPGVVPERPSSPNIPLNLSVAAALGMIFSWLCLTVEYGLRPAKPETLGEEAWMGSGS